MAMQLAQKRVVKWPVTVRVPVDGGRYREEQFTAHFLIVKQSKVDEMELENIDFSLVDEALVGWSEVEDPDTKEPVPFSEEAKATAIDDPCIRRGLITAYGEAVKGRKGKS